jgi:predicted metal-dependent TIM-barrel fold hydrolase
MAKRYDMIPWVDPHIHMVSRTTDDYKRMALPGCVMVSEPVFWAGSTAWASETYAQIDLCLIFPRKLRMRG